MLCAAKRCWSKIWFLLPHPDSLLSLSSIPATIPVSNPPVVASSSNCVDLWTDLECQPEERRRKAGEIDFSTYDCTKLDWSALLAMQGIIKMIGAGWSMHGIAAVRGTNLLQFVIVVCLPPAFQMSHSLNSNPIVQVLSHTSPWGSWAACCPRSNRSADLLCIYPAGQSLCSMAAYPSFLIMSTSLITWNNPGRLTM